MPPSVNDIEAVISGLKWDSNGLITAVLQDVHTEMVLMVAWMNAESLRQTQQLGEAVFWSRSRQAIWRKGETSGHVMRVVELRVDCDADTLLVRVDPTGPACHTGAETCFYRSFNEFTEELLAAKDTK